MKKALIFMFGVLWSCSLFGQDRHKATDSINELETVFLTDNKLEEFSVGQTLQRISDSTISHNQPALTSLLEYNTPIYFKEDGLGMVSSPAFRGTTASQTTVLWNGININSNLNGQTDFNTINTRAYNTIDLRAGGGSLIYGSGAIGGTIHLNNQLEFKNDLSNEVSLQYGSFDTYEATYSLEASSKIVSFQFYAMRNASQNDYKFKNREGRNTNGQFHNTVFNTTLGLKLNNYNQLNLYSEFYKSNRHFPVYHLTEIHTKYKDFNTRHLLEWESQFSQFSSVLKGAFISEHYKYYGDTRRNDHTYGKTKTFIGKYDLSFKPNNSMVLNAILSHDFTDGNGSDINRDLRNISSAALLFKHQPYEKLRYQIGFRKEITKTYSSPILYSLGIDYEFTPFYTTKLSVSKNFKRPSFNDLFWTNSGNPNLDAETSRQIELGNTLKYKNLDWTLTGYFNDIKDMIHWLPTSNGLFEPRNEDHVRTYGVETILNWEKNFGSQNLVLNATYAYTISKDKETNKQLIYVPYHKATFSAAYKLGHWLLDYQILYNGEVFLHTDNDPDEVLKDYSISNIGVSYQFGKQIDLRVGGRVRNIFDKAYENVKRYELPGINYSIFVNLKF